jgi:hypothetical protein
MNIEIQRARIRVVKDNNGELKLPRVKRDLPVSALMILLEE